MPPMISDEERESDSGPDMVPAKTPTKADVVEAAEVDDDEEDEDEYRVEKILSHGYGKGGVVIYQIKWLGYDDPADQTWEPVENLDGALELLEEYHESIGGAPEPKGKVKKGPKPNKRTASDALDSSATESAKKKGRKSTGDVANGATKQKKLPEGSWEDHVMRVSSIIEETNPTMVKGMKARSKDLLGLLEWNDSRKTQHPLETLRRKCPQKLLDYYEQHLVFRSGGDDS